ADLAQLRFALALLHGKYVDPTTALKIAEGVDPHLLDEKTRKHMAGRVAFWKEWKYDILATGRSYRADHLLRESGEFAERKQYAEAAQRLARVVLELPNGYYPLKSGVILGSGYRARKQLAAMVGEHADEVAEAAEAVSPGLGARAAEGDRKALETLARAYLCTPQGWAAMLRLGEEDLDAGRAELAALRFRRCLSLAAGSRSRAEALWRLAAAEIAGRRRAAAEKALSDLVAVKGGKVRVRGEDLAAGKAAALIRREMPLPAVTAGSALEVKGGEALRPRWVFTSKPAHWDLDNRLTRWPRFWRRPESEPAVEGDRVFLHDSANVWALDWRAGRLLWHYRSPEMSRQFHHRGRSFSNQINEACLTGRGYSLGVTAGRVCGRFRRHGHYLWYELRCLSAGDGRLLWSTEGNPDLKGLSYASDPVGANDRFYVLAFTPIHTSGAYLVCLDPEDGRVIWKSQVAAGIDAGGSDIGNFFSAHGGMAVHGGRIYLSSDRGCFVAMDALDGSLIWVHGYDRVFEKGGWVGIRSHTTRADVGAMIERAHSRPVVGERSVYCLAKDTPGAFALDKATGRRTFVQLPRTAVEFIGESEGLTVAASRRCMFAMRATDGEVVWERPLKTGGCWQSGFMAGDRICWPEGRELVIISAADGKELGRAAIKTRERPATIRALPDGNLLALGSAGVVDRCWVLAPGAGEPRALAATVPGAKTDPLSLAVVHPRCAELAAMPVKPPERTPLPPLELLWRSEFSPEQLFTCRVPVRVLGSPPRLLVAAGTELRCHRLDREGALLWKAPVGPGPREISEWSGGRICLRWKNGVEIYDLVSGRRLWGWSEWPLWGAAEGAKGVALVYRRTTFAAVRMSDDKVLWTRNIVN
ncbi:MAG: outer membrane protein assembly factor BamB family protein, partial [Planctomycetota bacterium]